MQTARRSDGFRCEDAAGLRSDGFRCEDADRASQRRILLKIIFIDPKLASASLWFFHRHQRK